MAAPASLDIGILTQILGSLLSLDPQNGGVGGEKKKKDDDVPKGFQNFLPSAGVAVPGGPVFGPQSFQGSPTFTGGAIFPRNKSQDRIRNIAALINNTIQGIMAARK